MFGKGRKAQPEVLEGTGGSPELLGEDGRPTRRFGRGREAPSEV